MECRIAPLMEQAEAAFQETGEKQRLFVEQLLLNVFDARRLSDGPLATARLPYGLPLGLHLIAPAFGEETLFRAAGVLETAAGFDARP